MNPYVTGAMIKKLREQRHLTQSELAMLLDVSDKTISKWETGKGYPDITLLEPLARTFRVSVSELLAGEYASNTNTSGNMLKSKFYVCPVCGNVIHSLGESNSMCHGISLISEETNDCDEDHMPFIEIIEDEYYVELNHSMSKDHYISFMAALGADELQYKKLYPESACATRFKVRGVKKIVFYCNKHGLFSYTIKK